MTSAILARVRFYQDSATKGLWQNFFVDKTVDGYVFVNFNVSDILMNRTADEGGVTLTVPATKDYIDFFLAAIEGEYLAEIILYEQPVTTALPTGFDGATVVSRFIGEVQTFDMDLIQLTVSLGTAIDAVNGEIPGRAHHH